MSSIAIYMEGGGDSKETKAPLRTGMGAFLGQLRDKARGRGWNWKIVACGRREQAYLAFMNAVRVEPDAVNILLVDAEALRANIAETLSPALITEQGENGNQSERESEAEWIGLGLGVSVAVLF